ncbi:flavin monoamine oxidase family protein [Guptibacillus algicola]|uniref:flavin monoamine oxidase family protein n=1 Tax=Guptibacillus algicola TaxID=225844 RepID=UPI001CD557FE|nr:flavin monoamine oxidase family protein [Alkalihalobacillus algicola]MCA0988346.1 flavin monoamine oxidase family protein [Alkalihalobacillus algicola]
MYQPISQSLRYPDDMLAIIRNGLREQNRKLNVTIVGGGMSGLVSASLLKKAGHNVTILEGNNRVGGRVYTVRDPFTNGKYLDVGAMRIPVTHKLTYEYIDRFQLPINKFINSSPKDILYANGIKASRAEYEKNPDILGFPVEPDERGKTATELFLSAVQPFYTLYENGDQKQKEFLRRKFDRYSMENFLRYNPIGPSLSPNAVRMIKVLLGIEGFSELSFVDILTDIVNTVFNTDLEFNEITGGNDKLPESFIHQLEDNFLYNEKVHRLIQRPRNIVVQTRNQKTGDINTFKSDIVIMTVPFSVFQFIEVLPYHSFSFEKWKAIRELHYVASMKIGIQFKERFWEKEGLKGANLISDFPNRYTYTPSRTEDDPSSSGVLLASYSWEDNAMLWNSLSLDQQITQSLEDLAKVHGKRVFDDYQVGTSFSWSQNEFSGGCFTLYKPNQITEFENVVTKPEGRVHFAGEHTSSFHGWIEGAIESGIRAAFEVNNRKDI